MPSTPIALFPLAEVSWNKRIRIGPVEFMPLSLNKLADPSLADPSLLEAHFPETLTANVLESVDPAEQSFIVGSAACLLCFATKFSSLYHASTDINLPPFSAWAWAEHAPANREMKPSIVRFTEPDPSLIATFHRLLMDACVPDETLPREQLLASRRFVTALRFFMNCFHIPFSLPVARRELSSKLTGFEVEQSAYLALAFQALLRIPTHQPEMDLKLKLRKLLDLRFTKPIELFWKWVEGYYRLRQNVIKGKAPKPLFHSNPDLEVSHFYLGIKLFVFSFLKMLGADPKLLATIHQDLLIFFWPESALIQRIVKGQKEQEIRPNEELQRDLRDLTKTYVHLYRNYIEKGPKDPLIEYHAMPIETLQPHISQALEIKSDALDAEFLSCVKKRLDSSR